MAIPKNPTFVRKFMILQGLPVGTIIKERPSGTLYHVIKPGLLDRYIGHQEILSLRAFWVRQSEAPEIFSVPAKYLPAAARLEEPTGLSQKDEENAHLLAEGSTQ